MRVTLHCVDNKHHFVGTNAAGLQTHFDTPPEEGGSGNAPGPMQTVAMAMGACSGIDVVDILKKYRQVVEAFSIEVDYERAQDQTPAVFTKIHAHYLFEGDLEPPKVRRAIELSVRKYCSVSSMLEKTAEITFSFSVNGTRYE